MPRKGSKLAPVNQFSRMLNPNARSKRLRLHQKAAFRKHAIGIRSAMASCQNARRTRDSLTPGSALCIHCGQSVPVPFKAGQTRFKPHLTAHAQNRKAQVFYDLHQLIRPDMRLGHGFYFLRRAILREDRNHFLCARILDSRGKLPIGKRARTAFPENRVARFVKNASLPKPCDIRFPRIDFPAPFQYKRAVSVFGKLIGRKNPSRPKPHHNDGRLERLRAKGKLAWRLLRRTCNANTGTAQHACLVLLGEANGYRIGKADVFLFARIQRNTIYAQRMDRAFGHSKSPRRKFLERGLLRVKRQFQFRQNQRHTYSLFDGDLYGLIGCKFILQI